MIVRYHELARQEFIAVIDYYSQIRVGLGAEFRQQLDKAIDLIAQNPLRFEQVRPGIRRCLLDRFPYAVYYRVLDADVVQIVVVTHHRRRPGYGMRRS